jgi:hypothetical protein
MMTDEEKATINRLFASQSLLYFDTEHDDTTLQTVCRNIASSEQAWLDKQLAGDQSSQTKVLLAFFESDEFQAIALEDADGSAAIGLSTFIAVQISWIFLNALAHREFLKEVGNADLELHPNELRVIPFPFRKPRCPQRFAVAKILCQLAVRFLTAHELTHILHGHLRLKRIQGQSLCLKERPTLANQERSLESQTLEMDADSGAVLLTLNTVMMPDEALSAEDGAGWDPIHRNRTLITNLWCIAIYTLFRSFESVPVKIEESSHPPPIRRALMAFGTFSALQQRDRPAESDESIQTSATRAMIEVERLIAWIVDAPPDLGPIRGATVPDDYSSKLLNEWCRLRPLLEPLNRGKGKLAPAQTNA